MVWNCQCCWKYEKHKGADDLLAKTLLPRIRNQWSWWKTRNNPEITKTGIVSCTRIIKGKKEQRISFTLKTPHQSSFCTISILRFIKRFPISGCCASKLQYLLVYLSNFKLLKKSLLGVATWRGDTAVAQLKPAGNSCQPQYFIFQVVPASTRTSDHLEKWHSAAHLSPILVGNNGRNRSFAPTLLPALHQLAFNISCIKLLARKHIWIMYTLAARFLFYIKR